MMRQVPWLRLSTVPQRRQVSISSREEYPEELRLLRSVFSGALLTIYLHSYGRHKEDIQVGSLL